MTEKQDKPVTLVSESMCGHANVSSSGCDICKEIDRAVAVLRDPAARRRSRRS